MVMSIVVSCKELKHLTAMEPEPEPEPALN